MKGVILAGGSGSRLAPLTRITNKHLLPLYDRPMVTYAVEALVEAGVEELMLVTGGTHAGEFFRLLGNGEEYGIERLLYAYQEQEGGVPEALGLAERFVGGDSSCVLLADNVFERSLRPVVERFEALSAAHSSWSRRSRTTNTSATSVWRSSTRPPRSCRREAGIPPSRLGVTGLYSTTSKSDVLPTSNGPAATSSGSQTSSIGASNAERSTCS
jgi:dTDP-glucose pyrophosphorylase